MTDTIDIKKYVTRGKMVFATEALDINDPDHPYNQIASQGLVPEDFGFEHPNTIRFKPFSRAQLIKMILKLEEELDR